LPRPKLWTSPRRLPKMVKQRVKRSCRRRLSLSGQRNSQTLRLLFSSCTGWFHWESCSLAFLMRINSTKSLKRMMKSSLSSPFTMILRTQLRRNKVN
jgi:hypothetical protein